MSNEIGENSKSEIQNNFRNEPSTSASAAPLAPPLTDSESGDNNEDPNVRRRVESLNVMC